MTETLQAETDGRRRRAQDSRSRIVAAMLALTAEGQISVSAELVAERAQVGLRTVFRHFKDMDSLYREISLIMEARLNRQIEVGFSAPTWRGRLAELMQRRAGIFEMITPFKRAEAALRHRSRFLEEDTHRLNSRLREILAGVLPPELVAQPHIFEALDLLLSFEGWERLRREQRLPPDEARAVLEAAVDKLLA